MEGSEALYPSKIICGNNNYDKANPTYDDESNADEESLYCVILLKKYLDNLLQAMWNDWHDLIQFSISVTWYSFASFSSCIFRRLSRCKTFEEPSMQTSPRLIHISFRKQ